MSDAAWRILVADDHPVFLFGLTNLVDSVPGMRVVASCKDGNEAAVKMRELRPDVAVLDMSMPGATGLEVLRELQGENLPTKVVVLTATATDQELTRTVSSGAWGVLLKDSAADELAECLRCVVEGRRWLPAELIEPATRREALRVYEKEKHSGVLTAREREIARLVAAGMSNKEISRYIDISDGTVKIHLHNIYQKLGVKNRTSLATLAQRFWADHDNGST